MEKEFDFKNIGKRMPYRTPDGFFGKMQKQVLERTQAERFNRQNRIKLIIGATLAIAAVMLGVLFFPISQPVAEELPSHSYNEIAKETSVGDLYSSKISLHTVGSIDDNEFEKIYNETKNSVFKDSTLEKAIINKKLSCAQCLKLMSLYTFDNDKLKMLQVLKDHIADTTNYDNIVNSLDFISSKNKAKEILRIP